MKTFNDLYLDYEDEELEVRVALEATGISPKVAAEAAKVYQLGKAQDLIYSERAIAAGASFNTVKKIVQSNIKKRTKARPEFDTKLRSALLKSRKLPDLVQAYQAHHIVAKGASRAHQAIAVLEALGIDIDDPNNGVFLPASDVDKKKGVLKKAYVHNTIHTKRYYANVTFEVLTQYGENAHKSEDEQKTGMKKLLNRIGEQLTSGSYPINRYIPGAETALT